MVVYSSEQEQRKRTNEHDEKKKHKIKRTAWELGFPYLGQYFGNDGSSNDDLLNVKA